jgi:CRP/FNR family cyclic AMP-dependent transcriptional regulator
MAGAEDNSKPQDSAPDPDARTPRLERFARRFAAGELLFRDGDPAGEAFLLQEGRVRLLKRVGAMERSLRVLNPGDLFGESALVAGTPHNSTAVALSAGSALVLDQETFRHVLAGNPSVGSRVLQQLIRRLRDAEDQIEILMVRDTQSKVAVALVKLARQAAGSLESGEGPLALDVSPMDLSSRVGLDVDTVKRAVLQLRESGYVRIAEEKLVIENLDALAELVGLLAVKDQIVGGSSPDGGAQPSRRRSG